MNGIYTNAFSTIAKIPYADCKVPSASSRRTYVENANLNTLELLSRPQAKK